MSSLEQIHTWITEKQTTGHRLLQAINDNWELQLTEKQLSYMEGRIKQLEEMETLISEYMENEANDT